MQENCNYQLCVTKIYSYQRKVKRTEQYLYLFSINQRIDFTLNWISKRKKNKQKIQSQKKKQNMQQVFSNLAAAWFTENITESRDDVCDGMLMYHSPALI